MPKLSSRADLARRHAVRYWWSWRGRLQRVRSDSSGTVGRRYDLPAAALFLFLQIAVDGTQIVVETGGVRIACSADFLNNRVGPRHGFTSVISSGVQIIGASNPILAQTF